jgi:hypothetical protein
MAELQLPKLIVAATIASAHTRIMVFDQVFSLAPGLLPKKDIHRMPHHASQSLLEIAA